MDTTDIDDIITECLTEMQAAHRDKYDGLKADKTAALFLIAQMKLSFLIEEAEMKAKHSRNEITRLEGEKYFEYKLANSDKKITENMITSYVAKEQAVVEAKSDCISFEATLKKWNYLLDVLKNGHIFFRNLGKNKTWSE